MLTITPWDRVHGGPVRELNPGPLAPEARIIPLDQRATMIVTKPQTQLFIIFFVSTRPNKTSAGSAGYRSPCLSHAKRALYHLSYTPELSSHGDQLARECRRVRPRRGAAVSFRARMGPVRQHLPLDQAMSLGCVLCPIAAESPSWTESGETRKSRRSPRSSLSSNGGLLPADARRTVRSSLYTDAASPFAVLASAVHILKLERYRED